MDINGGGTRESTWSYNTDEQVIGLTNTGHGRVGFHMEPSKLYYSEITYLNSGKNGDSGFAITQDGLTLGMNHIGKFNGLHGLETGDLYVPTGVRRLPKGQQQADECPYVTYFTRNGWGDYFELRNNTFFNNLFKKDSDGKTDYSFKFAVARNGKMFYSFVNDTLVGVYSNPEFENITSIPGAYMYGSGSNATMFAKGINYPKDGQASLFAKVAGWDRSNGTKLTLDDSEGINFKLTRKVVDGLDHYTLIAASVKNPSETQQVSINSTKFNGKIRLLFQNRRLSGTYTNIMYSNIAE